MRNIRGKMGPDMTPSLPFSSVLSQTLTSPNYHPTILYPNFPQMDTSRTKRINLMLVVIFLVSLCFSGHAPARSLKEIKESNDLRICVAGSSYQLYTTMGLAFAEVMGIPATLKHLDSWDQQFHNQDGITIKEAQYTPALLANGDCDFYPNDIVMNNWRLKKLNFVILFRTQMVVVVHTDNLANYTTLSDLAGKTVAVQKGTSYSTWIEQQNASDFAKNPMRIEFMSTDESMQAVDDKLVDFTIIGADGALNWTRNKIKHSSVAFPIGEASQVGWAFRKQDKDLQIVVKDFFDSQARAGSRLDAIWAEKVGIPLSEFTLFIANLLQD